MKYLNLLICLNQRLCYFVIFKQCFRICAQMMCNGKLIKNGNVLTQCFCGILYPCVSFFIAGFQHLFPLFQRGNTAFRIQSIHLCLNRGDLFQDFGHFLLEKCLFGFMPCFLAIHVFDQPLKGFSSGSI